jgi:hypothetical protein
MLGMAPFWWAERVAQAGMAAGGAGRVPAVDPRLRPAVVADGGGWQRDAPDPCIKETPSEMVMRCRSALIILFPVLLTAGDPAPDPALPPWPAPVPGFVAPAPGEHPRLFFRPADLPALRARAETPAGQAILQRLRYLLDNGDGTTLPKQVRPQDAPFGDDSKPIDLPDGAYSMSHVAGYGFLYRLTGEQRYADLGRQAMEMAFNGCRDRDSKGRYAWKRPTGALRAGPALGWYAVGYDLCYDGWDEAFRTKVAQAIQDYNEGEWEEIGKLARGARLGYTSNHAGPQIGGAALALLAIRGDPGTDAEKVEGLLKVSAESVLGQLTHGWSESGWYSQGDGTGCISSDNALIPAMQAWKVAGGQDFITPRITAQMMTLKWLYGTVLIKGRPVFPSRGMYPHNVWARSGGGGGGLSGCGTFAQGFGAIDDAYRPALLWFYNHYFKAVDDAAGAPCDTVSPYPHRAILALVNWPFDLAEKNPAEVMPRVSNRLGGSRRGGYVFCRNQWSDETDLVASLFGYNIYQNIFLGYGLKLEFTQLPGSTFNYYRDFDDGSIIISNAKGQTYLALDFSRATGADLVLVVTGKGAQGGQDHQGSAGNVKSQRVTVGDREYLVCTWQTKDPPSVAATTDAVMVGGRPIRFDGEKLVVDHLNAEDAGAKPAAPAPAPAP